MFFNKDFSVIVPCWRGAAPFLPKLFASIPEQDNLEIIVVDNSEEPLRREEIKSSRDFVFLHSEHNRHAGGSRNDGIEVAQGKWLIFADADDYFTEDAFSVFNDNVGTDSEIVYTCMGGVFEDTGEPSDRGQYYSRLIKDFCEGGIEEIILRTRFYSPCCKMVSHELVVREKLRYDEIRAGNDVYFSLTSGYLAKKIKAVDKVTYVATVNKGSLTQRRDYEVIKARLYSKLHCNVFLKKIGCADLQFSIMSNFYECRRYGIKSFLEFIRMVIRYRQNPFVGCGGWIKTFSKMKKKEKVYSKYITK